MACVLTLLLACIGFSSCNHKDLVYEDSRTGHLNVIFDWRNAPGANPASMAFYLYHTDGSVPLRFIFQNNTGGTIKVPTAEYSGMCLNADITDWAVISGAESIYEYEISTTDTEFLPATGLPTRGLPRGPETNEERFAGTPGMLWGDQTNGISIPDNTQDKTIVMYPEEKICHYTVDVYDSGDVGRYVESGIDASLSGMSEGYMVGKDCSATSLVTHPFLLKPNYSDNSLHAEFLTFGESPASAKHILSIYLIRDDGKKWNCNVDVTDQVKNAPDPRNVHIIVSGLDLPNPISGGTGVIPEVDDWVSVNINMHM